MFDLGWSELLVIGVVALIVVGPKDLPVMFRNLGRMTARLRAMARDFTRAMEEAADESGMKDVAKDLRTMTSPKTYSRDAIKKASGLDWDDPFGDIDDTDTPAKPKRGPETEKFTAERAEAARKIQESAAARATARREAEAAVHDAADAAAREPADDNAATPADSEKT